jgi:hypothetical protein
MFYIHRSGPFGLWLATDPNGGDPVATDLQKLISEYCAIEKMDCALQQADSVDETELIGLTARVMRRREILRELTAWITVAEDLLKQASETSPLWPQ